MTERTREAIIILRIIIGMAVFLLGLATDSAAIYIPEMTVGALLALVACWEVPSASARVRERERRWRVRLTE